MKNYIKKAVIAKSGKDDTERPVQQIESLGKTTDAEIIFPYGVHANLPEGSLLVVLPVLDQSSNLVAFGGLPNERIQVESGEVVFFHPLTKSRVHFKKDGNIEINSLEKDLLVTCKNAIIKSSGNVDITVSGNSNVTINGDANLTVSGNLTVEAPTTDWNGNINLTGDLTASGTVEGTTEVVGAGISLSTHTHIGSPTAPTGAISPTGVPVP